MLVGRTSLEKVGDLGSKGSGIGVWGFRDLGTRVWGVGLGVWELWFRVWGVGFRVHDLGIRV